MAISSSIPLRVLIAEDEPLVAGVIEHELETVGVRAIATAADGRQAVELTARLRPDLVLMDIEMPDLNGLAAARQIQEECPTPVVLLTVYSETRTVEEAAAAGVGAYLLKPPRASDLERAIVIARARFADSVALRRINAELRATLNRFKHLQGLLPICMYCHRIRTDRQSWQRIEEYLSQHSEIRFTHGICPDCTLQHFPEIVSDPPH